MLINYSVKQCFSTGVPRLAAGGSAETNRNCLVQNPQPQFYAVVAIQTLGSLYRVSSVTQTFAEVSAEAKKVEKHWCKNAVTKHFCALVLFYYTC